MLSKKLQKIGVAGLASILLFGGSVSQVFALNDTNMNKSVKVQRYYNYKTAKYPSFEDFMKNDVKKKDVSEEDMSELERLYDIALEFKKDGKYTKANDVMKSFYAISNQYEDLYVSNYVNNRINIRVTYPTFEDFMENDVKKQDISEGDMIELERLYNIAVDYKKEGKFIEANDVMKSFNNIVNEYSDIVIENTNNVEIDI